MSANLQALDVWSTTGTVVGLSHPPLYTMAHLYQELLIRYSPISVGTASTIIKSPTTK